ncbi:protoporphyrinogen oxidase [Paenibacillus sp. JX-17]|uniref:Coproporphyrinogen III oxidase n=1 Tax=Paenibacillus lacisoli TaxID=3064525 RepID=A0ABT9CK57_9BACL|nr:protoporphyrinogen oxidase [Paenibacillus sp. JX-17]MDO7908307.1 protoporphyrinogen oxidase [Paenibacillus sp. JX-17]
MKKIVVIGGGITGLSAVYTLQKYAAQAEQEMELTLIEAGQELGGKIRTVKDGEFIMETGADSIVARKSNVAPLLEELGLNTEVVYNATGRSFIYTEEGLKKIPEESLFGIPLSLESLATSELVSAEGKVEALKDFYTPNETFTEQDSLGSFLEYFLGAELVRKQIEPVVSGVYSGELDDLTIASTFPYLLQYKNEYGSLMKGLGEHKQKFLSGGSKKFISFDTGMSELIGTMERKLEGVRLRKGTKVRRVRHGLEGYEITTSDDEKLYADYVVLAVPHQAAQAMLQHAALDKDFDRLSNRSLISIYAAFDVPDEQLPEDGTGFIVGKDSDLKCNACTWTSRKWAHTSANNRLLVRLFYKSSGAHYEELVRMDENQLLDVALDDVRRSLGITAKPVMHNVTKWMDSMPNYHLQHPQLVKSLERTMEEQFPKVLLAGCSYYGVGIPDCIADGERAAKRILEETSIQ